MRENNIIISGKLIKARKQIKEFKGKKSEEKTYITLAECNLEGEELKAVKETFKKSGERFTPEWVKDYKGFVNVSTKFEIPTKDNTTEDIYKDVLEFVDSNDWHNAHCRLKISLKDGAIYPISLVIDSEGEPFDNFADFE